MSSFVKEVEVLETYFENADTNALEEALSFDEAGSTNEETGNTGLLVRINNFIQGVIERIHQMYRELRVKMQAKLVNARLAKLKDKTAYTVYQNTRSVQVAMQVRKLIAVHDDGLKEIYKIYGRGLSGSIPYQTAVMQAKVAVQTYSDKMDKVASKMALTTTAKKNAKRTLYKKEIKRLLDEQQKEHAKITEDLEKSIIAYEKKISSDAKGIKLLRKDHMGLSSAIASLASKLNRCAAHQTARVFSVLSGACLKVMLGDV